MMVAAPGRKTHKTYRPLDAALLTRREASEYIGVSISSLSHWSRASRGPSLRKIGKSVYYHRDDLDAWVYAQIVRERS